MFLQATCNGIFQPELTIACPKNVIILILQFHRARNVSWNRTKRYQYSMTKRGLANAYHIDFEGVPRWQRYESLEHFEEI